MSVELNDIRKSRSIKVPSGALIEIWDDEKYGVTSKLEGLFLKHSKIDKDGQPTDIDMSDPDIKTEIDNQLMSRIKDWDYTENGEKLPVSIDNLKKLPSKDVNALKQEINKTAITEKVSKNG